MKPRFAWLVLVVAAACGDNLVNDPAPELVTPQIFVTVVEDSAVTFDTEAVDPDGQNLTYKASAPAHGTLTGVGPVYTYRPEANYAGMDQLVVAISDGRNAIDISVAITVTAADDAPIAQDIAAMTNEAQSVAITLVATDIDSTALSYHIVAPPQHGAIIGAPPNVMYTPAVLYSGSDSMTYKASDDTQDSNLATVAITIVPILGADQHNPDGSR